MSRTTLIDTKITLSIIPSIFIVFALAGLLSSCGLIIGVPKATQSEGLVAQTSVNKPRSQQLILASPTVFETETPTLTPEPLATQTPEPSTTAEATKAVLDLQGIIDLNQLTLIDKSMLEAGLSVGADMFKKGEICGEVVIKESGFSSSQPDSYTTEPHLGLLTGSEDWVDFQGCVLAGFLQSVEDKDGQLYENLYLAIGYESRQSGDRKITLFRIELGKLLAAKYRFNIKYIHGDSIFALGTHYHLTSRDEVLAFWKKMLGKPVTFQLDFWDTQPFSAQDIEHLRSVGTDPELLYKIAKANNPSRKLNKGLASAAYCQKNGDDFDIICDIRGENPAIDINSLGDALLLMDGRLLPIAYYVMVRGAGLEY